ncbi:sulfite exporter TauE/SafE family protein [Nakamurella lactea]|uniref:sulfite exporter TauE/SafE family protein n=1 Tax=Nakamurella lactea TaxID=459515 RepID=UPI00048F373B|nr:sulfite exporter TauE/SafE family protein [Nakamurella lactea]
MSTVEIILILVAGIGAGTINAVVGSGTLITFPTLIAFGFPPVVATMSNAVGQIPGGLSASWGYRRELEGQGPRIRQLLPASLLGAITGSWLLLHLPPTVFEVIVPALLVLALILVITQPFIQRWVRRRKAAAGLDHTVLTARQNVLLVIAVYLIGVYGGYFTAAQGVLMVGVMGAMLPESLQRINAIKNVLTAVVNVVAAAAYTMFRFHEINWAAAGLIAVGTLIGGFVGSSFGRRLHPVALRCIIVVLGSVAIWRLLAG